MEVTAAEATVATIEAAAAAAIAVTTGVAEMTVAATAETAGEAEVGARELQYANAYSKRRCGLRS